MSRRTKLCITALLLALLAVPATYIILTWHMHEPIRCRCVETYSDRPGGPVRGIVVEATNGSPWPVYLCERTLLCDMPPKVPVGYVDLQGLPPACFSLLNPRETRRIRFQLLTDEVMRKPLANQLQVYYECRSETRNYCLRLLTSLAERTPMSWNLGQFSGKDDAFSAPLQMPANLPASSTPPAKD